jgi:hypothetical protein
MEVKDTERERDGSRIQGKREGWKWRILGGRGMEVEDTGGEGWKWRIQGGIVMEDTGREREQGTGEDTGRAREGCGGYRKGE